jgi:hypothetical protein
MPPTRTIAGLIGPLTAAVGLSLVARPAEFAHVTASLQSSLAVVYLTGCLLLVAGCAVVRTHNVWALRWPTIVTVLGWVYILAGLARMLFPRAMASRTDELAAMSAPLAVGGALALILGLFLTFMSLRTRSGAPASSQGPAP